MTETTYQQVRDNFLQDLAENAYLTMCSTQEMELAINALEKQVPKKPFFEGDSEDEDGNIIYDTWLCPCCEDYFEVEYEEHDYCPTCGQAIDWEG